MRKRLVLVGALAALSACNRQPSDGPPAAASTGQQVAAPDASKTHSVACTAEFGDVRRTVAVEVQVADPQVGALQLGPPTSQVVGEAGRDITPKDFARLEQAIAQAINERVGRPVAVRARIVEVRYERIDPGPGARRGPSLGES